MKLSWKLFFITTPIFILFLTIFGSWMIQDNFQGNLEREIQRCMVENQMFQNSYELTRNSLTKEQRRALVQVLKHFTLELTGPRPVSEAIVTAGGVKVGEVTPNTMASKRVGVLFFAGEVLDVDAYTGVFNLQIAWATGYLAGLSAAESEEMT